ncbi:MAG: hypothetical protein HKN22_06300, partial [Bacteroidia bacterium]|nr:hypothetical protein [Bacteroidia bacterium]
MRIVLFIIVSSLYSSSLFAQKYFLPINREYNLKYEKQINKVGSTVHSSVKPYMSTQLEDPWRKDTLKFFEGAKFYSTDVGEKIFSEDLIGYEQDDFEFYVNPLFDFHIGRDNTNDLNYYTNTRGVWLRGRLGDRVT